MRGSCWLVLVEGALEGNKEIVGDGRSMVEILEVVEEAGLWCWNDSCCGCRCEGNGKGCGGDGAGGVNAKAAGRDGRWCGEA